MKNTIMQRMPRVPLLITALVGLAGPLTAVHAQINWGTPGANAARQPTANAQGVVQPGNLHRAADVTECGQHGARDCSQAGNPAYAMLVWSGDSAATGYRIYRTDGGAPQRVGDVSGAQPGNALTAIRGSNVLPTAFGIASPPQSACYAVSELKGNLEGPLSATWCMSAANGSTNTLPSSPSAIASAPSAMAQRSAFAGGPASAWHPGSPKQLGSTPVADLTLIPTGLHQTASVAECAAHAADTTNLCTQLNNAGFLLLVWNTVKGATIYNLYHADPGLTSMVGQVRTSSDGSLATEFALNNVAVGACVTVSGVHDGVEGPRSEPWCLQKSIGPVAQVISGEKNINAATTPEAPTELKTTTSADECRQHQGNVICAALQGGAQTITVLVWKGARSAQKYTVYRVRSDATLSDPVREGSNTGLFDGVVPTAFSLDKVTAGSCYTVTATLDGHESPSSGKVCPESSAKSLTLQPAQTQSYATVGGGQGCNAFSIFGAFDGSNLQPGRRPGVIVGYRAVTASCQGEFGSNGTFTVNEYFRAGVFFDLTSLTSVRILRAVLVLPVESTGDRPSAASCVTTVSNGATRWWTNTDPIGVGIPSLSATALAGEVDVTSLVNAWITGAARGGADNDGFVLTGATEDLNNITGACLTTYGMPTLVLTTQ